MQTTLRIDDAVYREAKVEAARQGLTVTEFISEALRERVARLRGDGADRSEVRAAQLAELVKKSKHFKIGKRPTRAEMNER
jgi:hypothetical protein